MIGAHANRALAPLGRKIGPDPASIATCTAGGILANNASGMCCGVAQNAYHTLESLTFVLPSGTTIDTARPEADDLLRAAEPALWHGLLDQKARVEADAALAARIRAKYRMKNTMGYSLNAFLDFARPVDVFAHLLIGSEGTLAFIAEAVLRTVPDLPVKYTGLPLFADLYAACRAIVPLNAAGAKALEAMDRAALRSVEDEPGVPDVLRALPPGAAGLLAEFQAEAERERPSLEAGAARAVAGLALISPPLFTHDAADRRSCGRCARGCSRPSARYGRAARPSSSRTSRFRWSASRTPSVALERALLRAWVRRGDRLRPRARREPPLRDHAVVPDGRGGRPVRALPGRRRRPRREPVRRRAQGRARHGPEHGAVRRDGMGRGGPGPSCAASRSSATRGAS